MSKRTSSVSTYATRRASFLAFSRNQQKDITKALAYVYSVIDEIKDTAPNRAERLKYAADTVTMLSIRWGAECGNNPHSTLRDKSSNTAGAPLHLPDVGPGSDYV